MCVHTNMSLCPHEWMCVMWRSRWHSCRRQGGKLQEGSVVRCIVTGGECCKVYSYRRGVL